MSLEFMGVSFCDLLLAFQVSIMVDFLLLTYWMVTEAIIRGCML